MYSFQKLKIENVCESVTSGGTPKSNQEEYYKDGNIPWLNTKEVHFNRIYRTEKNITEAGLNNSSAKWIAKNSVIVAMYGVTAGNVAIARIPLTTNQACCNLTIDKNIADYRYIYYYLLYKNVELSSMANGGAQQNLNSVQIKNFEINLPNITYQNKIADYLWTIDNKIEINNRINDNLEQQAQAVFLKSTNSNNFDNKLLSEVATIKYGKGLPTNKLAKAGYKVFGGNGIIGYYTEYLYKEPQILISCRGAASGTILESHPYSYITNNSLIVELNDRRYYEFLKQYFLLNQLHSYATGSAQPQITIDNLKTVEVPYPNYEVISDIDAYFTSISNKIYENICENEKLASLRDTLLPKLMSGEIDVSNVDISTDKLSFICQIILIFHILHILYIFQTFISHRYR